jgi:hypothetical protein
LCRIADSLELIDLKLTRIRPLVDSIEKLAENHDMLLRERNHLRESLAMEKKANIRLAISAAGLKRTIKRLSKGKRK